MKDMTYRPFVGRFEAQEAGGPDGWTLRKGVYRKLRLTADSVAARLEAAGFAIEHHQAPGGMVALVGVLGVGNASG